HELATNAAKYGALSSMSGTVQVTWELAPGSLVLNWREAGGPPAQPPTTPGFGTPIITASIERQPRGRTLFDSRGDAPQCMLTVPRSETVDAPARARNGNAEHDHAPPEVEARLVVGGRRVLVVEDEALVAMILGDHLTELGFSVVGPCSRVADAIAVVKSE